MSSSRTNARKNIKLKNVSYVSPLAYVRTNPQRLLSTSRQNTTGHRQVHPNIIFLEKKNNFGFSDLSFSKSKRSTSNKISNLLKTTYNFNNIFTGNCSTSGNINNNSNNNRNYSNSSNRRGTSTSISMSNSQNFKNRIQSPSASKNNTSGNNLIINTRHSKANNSTDFAIQTSSSSSSLAKMQNSSINNIKVFYNELSKHLKKGKKEGDKLSRANTCTEENKKQTSTNGTKDSSSNTNSNATMRDKKNRLKKETKSYNGIDTPEELHFFYVNVIQNGKALENNF